MADNFVTNAGSGGNTFASDDVSGVHYSIGKIAYGALDSVTLVTTSSGFPVQFVGGTTLADDVANPSVPYVAAFGMVYDGTTWDRLRGTSGAVNIHDGGNSITVDGTVSVSGTVAVDTELATAAALADNTANPTVTSVGTFPHWYDGSTWDRAIGNSTDGLTVNLGANNDVSQAGTWTVQPGNTANTTPWLASIHDGTTKATVRDLASNDALNVAIVDGSGNQITSFGGGTQYAEDTAHVTGDSVTMAGVVQQSADAALSGDGDRAVLQVDATGYLKVNVKAALPAGTNAIGKLAANSGVDIGDVDVTSIVPGTGATNLGKAEDDPHTTGDVGVMALTVRQTSAGALSGTNGDYQPLITDANGRLYVLARSAGDVAHDAADGASDNPIKIGGYAKTTAPTAVSADGDRVNAWFDLNGRQVVWLDQALPAGTNAIGKLAANSGVDIGDVDILSIAAGDNNIGNVDIVTLPSIPAGTNNIGDVDVLTVPADPFGVNADAASATGSISAKLRFIASTGIPITGTVTVGSHAVTNAGTFAVQQTTGTSGGTLLNSQLSTAAVISTAVKASAGQVYGVHVFNNGANEVFLRLYNQTAAPAGGDNANIVYRAMIPGNAAGAGFIFNVPQGMEFSTGIGVRVTGAVGDTDTTVLAANEVMVNVLYK